MAPLPQLHPGTVFARDFRVQALLAHGGMGSLYVVEQVSTGKRRALKIMQPQLVSDPKARQRFELEARIGGQIESEHVVEVVGAGIDDATGTPWLAMELLEGGDLAKAIRERGRVPAPELHEIYLQLADGLGAAHKRGIVHRDLKPENLFIAVSRRRGIPFTLKILDFGIAKITQESQNTKNQTAAMGTPLWMAPEQTEQGELTPATDVWALGLIAFNALTGRVYWRAANQAEVGLTAVFAEVLVAPLDPPTVRAPQLGHMEPLPAGFDHWFLRCVARDRTLRFPDGAAAIAALGPGFTFETGGRSHGVAPTQAARAVAPTAMLEASQQPGGGYTPHSGYPQPGQGGGGYTPQPQQPGGGYAQPQQPGYTPQPPHAGGGYGQPQQPGGGYTPQPQHGGGHTPQPQHGGGHAPQPQHGGGYTPQPQHGGGYTPQQHGGGYTPQPQHSAGGPTPPVGYPTPGGLVPSAPPAGHAPGGYAPDASASGPTPYTTTGPAARPTGTSATRIVLSVAGLLGLTLCAAGGSYGAFSGYEAYMAGRTGPPPPPPPAAADAGAAVTTLVAVIPDAGAATVAMAPIDAGTDTGGVLDLAAGTTSEGATTAETDPDPAPSDTPYRWGDGEVRRFRGTVRWPSGLAASYVLTLNLNGSNVAGFFDWTVTALNPGSPNHIGQHFNEGVSGSWNAPALMLSGTPASGGRSYTYRLSGAGRLSGRDNEGGRNSGRVAR